MVKESNSVFKQMCIGHVKGFETLTQLNDKAKRSRNDPTIDEPTEEPAPVNIPDNSEKRRKVSKNEKWLPSEMMKKCCINNDGLPLPKEECESNIRSMMKNKKSIDFYELVELACQPGLTEEKIQKCLLSCSLFAFMLARDKTCPSSSGDPKNHNESIGFKLSEARLVDRAVIFPGGFRIKMTDYLTPMITSKWILTDDMTNSVAIVTREICKELHKKDPFWPFYTPPTTATKKVQYIILDDSIVETLSEIMIVGFELERTEGNSQKLLNQIASTLYSFIDKRRSEFNKKHGEGSCLASAKEFKDQLITSPNFRSDNTSNEMGLWDEDEGLYSGMHHPEYESGPSSSHSPHYMML